MPAPLEPTLPIHAVLRRGRLLLCLLLLLCGVAVPARAIDFSAYWEHRARGGNDQETVDQFDQRYSLSLGPAMTFQPTPAISIGAGIGYSRNDRDFGEGMITVEEITPSAQIALSNDIFTAGLSALYTENRPDEGESYTTDSWDATLASNWQRDLWPSLSLTYSERNETLPGPNDRNSLEIEDRSYSASVNWDLRLAKLYYDYSVGQVDDLVSESRVDRDSHLARIETTHSLWDRRLNVTLSHQYQQSDTDFTMLTPDGFAEQSLDLLDTRHRVTDFAALPPESDPDFDADLLGGYPPPVANGQRLYLAVEVSPVYPADALYLSVDTRQVSGYEVAALSWSLYVLSGGLWQLAALNLPATYNPALERVELPVELAVPERNLMVRADVVGLPADLVINRAEVVARINIDSTSRYTSNLSNASLRLQLTPTLAASSSLVLDRIDTETEFETEAGTSESESTRRVLTGRLQWYPTPLFAPAFGYSETLDEFDATSIDGVRLSSEEISRAYSLIVSTSPLPTLNVTLGATRTDRFSDGRKNFTSDGYNLSATALIYPALTANFNVNYLVSERSDLEAGVIIRPDELGEPTPIPTTFYQDGDTETLSSRLTLTARLSPALTADLSLNYSDSQSDRQVREVVDATGEVVTDELTGEPAVSSRSSSTSIVDSTLSLLYRPSDLLSMRITDTRYWSGTDIEDTLDYYLNLALLRTRNTRLTFNYQYSQGVETTNRFSLYGSWDISTALSLRTDVNYQMAEERDTWNTRVALSLRL